MQQGFFGYLYAVKRLKLAFIPPQHIVDFFHKLHKPSIARLCTEYLYPCTIPKYTIYDMPLSSYSDITLLAVRVMLAAVMLYFGLPKIKDPLKTAKTFVSKGARPGWAWGWMSIVVEVFGGCALLFGVFVTAGAVGAVVMGALGLFWDIVHFRKQFTHWSYNLLVLGLALVILTFGAGRLTLTNF